MINKKFFYICCIIFLNTNITYTAITEGIAIEKSSTAIGEGSRSEGKRSLAVGSYNITSGDGSSAIGFFNNYYYDSKETKWKRTESGKYSSAIGSLNQSIGDYSSAIGRLNRAEKERDVAVGFSNNASGPYSSAIGYSNKTSGQSSSAIGYSNNASENYSTSIGTLNTVIGKGSTAFGFYNDINGIKSHGYGYFNYTNSYGSLAFGSQNNNYFNPKYKITNKNYTGDFSMAFGIGNNNEGRSSLTLGHGNYALANKSAALGWGSYAKGVGTIAIGENAFVGNPEDYVENNHQIKSKVKDAIALGNFSLTNINDSVALGSYSLVKAEAGIFGYNPKTDSLTTVKDLIQNSGKTENEYQASFEKEISTRKDHEDLVILGEIILNIIQTEQLNKEEKQKAHNLYLEINQLEKDKVTEWSNAMKKLNDLNGAWRSTAGAISIGNEEIGITRQITGVSAGSKLTDAINLAQLKAWIPTFYSGGNINETGYKQGEKIENFNSLGALQIDFGDGLKAEKTEKNKLFVHVDNKYIDNQLKKVDNNYKKTIEGIAGSYAMATIPQVSYNRLFGIGAGIGYYDGKGSISVGISGQNKARNFIYKGSISIGSEYNIGVAAGFNLSLGKINEDQEKNIEVIKNTPINNDFDNRLNAIEQNNIALKKENENLKIEIDKIKKELSKSQEKLYIIDLFENDLYTPTNEQIIKLKAIVKEINEKYTEKSIDITGYTDTNHTEKYNLELGLKRANKVNELLIKFGLENPQNIRKVSSFGYNNQLNGGLINNRRVEIIIK